MTTLSKKKISKESEKSVIFEKIKKVSSSFFAYSWYLDHTEINHTLIRIYGLNEKNENVCVIIDNFTPYIYIELPSNVEWDVGKAQLISNKIDSIMTDKKPIVKQLMFKKKLYYANMGENMKKRLFPFLLCSFMCMADIDALRIKLRKPLNITGIGCISLKTHEHNARPILQLTSLRKLSTAGWIKFNGIRVQEEDQITRCKYEYKVNWKTLEPEKKDMVPRPLIMGYDIEVNSTIPNSMPKPERPGDKIFQISCVFKKQGEPETKSKKILLSLGKPDKKITGADVNIRCFKTEYELMIGFAELVKEKQPNLAIGHNIFKFDIPYMIERANFLFCLDSFEKQGFAKYVKPKIQEIDWSSSAYGNQKFCFMDMEGIIYVDLYPLIQRDYKLPNYKLSTIAKHFLKNQTKDPLDARGIFKCYKIGMEGGVKGSKAMGIVGKYCVQDSNLVVNIFEKMTAWIGLCEMSGVTGVPIVSLFTQGQQLKVFSQVYRKATHENIVVESDVYNTKADEHYVGAVVFPPIAGLYYKVVPFDFNSLYPTTIIAYNISWDTLVLDEGVPDHLCHIMEWEDHVGCVHDPKEVRKKELTDIIGKFEEEIKKYRIKRDAAKGANKDPFKKKIADLALECKPYKTERTELKKTNTKHKMCVKRRFRWLKAPLGILPEILTNLLEARKIAKDRLKTIKKELQTTTNPEEIISLKILAEVLDQRQNALKISANSAYGAMGVAKGRLPFMPGAMCTTYKGRISVQLAAKAIQEEHGGVLIYGDTDSNYVSFPHLETAKECWDYSIKVAEEVSKKFPKPMKLAFEDIIYWKFLLIVKKRYMCLACGEDGVISDDVKKKGVLLQRRDNCEFIRKVYGDIVMDIFNEKKPKDVLYKIIDFIRKLLGKYYCISEFEITKSVQDMEVFCEETTDIYPVISEEEGKICYRTGGYKIRKEQILSNDPIQRKKIYEQKEVTNSKEYYLACLPAQAQLAQKMRERGQLVPAGTRLEYVITTTGGLNAKQCVKIESTEYFNKHSSVLAIDYLYYLGQLCTPLDQILNIMYKGKKIQGYLFKINFVESIYKYRVQYSKVIQELQSLLRPKIRIK